MNNLDYVTVVVITKNEESNIRRCLESVAEFSNKIVVDSGSTDQTTRIAANLGATVIHQEWLGFGKQKQFAIEASPTNWVLSLDADEEVSPDLAKSIQSADLNDPTTGFLINRRSYFLGKPVLYSGWNPDWVLRLVNKKAAHFTNDAVHERLTGCQKVVKLNGKIHHYSYQSHADIDKKINLYGALSRQTRKRNKSRVLVATWTFARSFIFRLGFLDGVTGLHIALMNAKTSWIKYSD